MRSTTTTVVHGCAGYPARLLGLRDAPARLHIQGELAAAPPRAVAIVGSRAARGRGAGAARALAADLAAGGWLVVSGGALGIDAAAHRGALDAGGATVAVLASGLDAPYPGAAPATVRRDRRERGGAVRDPLRAGRAAAALALRAPQPHHRRPGRRRGGGRGGARLGLALHRCRRPATTAASCAPCPAPPAPRRSSPQGAALSSRPPPTCEAALGGRPRRPEVPLPLAGQRRGLRAGRARRRRPVRRGARSPAPGWRRARRPALSPAWSSRALRCRCRAAATYVRRSRRSCSRGRGDTWPTKQQPKLQPRPPRPASGAARAPPSPRRRRPPRPPRPPRPARPSAPARAAPARRAAAPFDKKSPRTAGSQSLVVVESPAKAQDHQEVPGRGLQGEGVGRARQGSAQVARSASTSRTTSSPSTWSSDGKKKVIGEIKQVGQDGRAASTWRPTPIARARRSPGTSPRRSSDVNPNIQRVLFNEITKKGITEALEHPRELDANKFESQQARRILDRLVGYQISPILWNKVQARAVGGARAVGRGAPGRRARGGDRRVQARGVLDRRGRRSSGQSPPPFAASVCQARRREGRARDHEGQADARSSPSCAQAPARGRRRSSARSARKNPPPPFITSQAAAGGGAQAALLAKRTMALAQRLYEGSSWARRARSVSSPTCVPTRRASPTTRYRGARRTSASSYGADVPARRADRLQDQEEAQDAHEAIRPDAR